MNSWSLSAVILAGVIVVMILFVRTWLRWRGTRIVICPETIGPVAVSVDAGYAAAESLVGESALRLASCSRWPERGHCGQQCLSQIRNADDGCLLSSMVAAWYEGKCCAICGEDIGPVVWYDRPPALRLEDSSTAEWNSLTPARLPRLLITSEPVCWNCHLAESFRHDHPDLVTDRPPHSLTPDVFPKKTTRPPSSDMVY